MKCDLRLELRKSWVCEVINSCEFILAFESVNVIGTSHTHVDSKVLWHTSDWMFISGVGANLTWTMPWYFLFVYILWNMILSQCFTYVHDHCLIFLETRKSSSLGVSINSSFSINLWLEESNSIILVFDGITLVLLVWCCWNKIERRTRIGRNW